MKENDITSQKRLIIDLENYLQFVELQKKKRPQFLRKKVEQIIEEESSIVVRIKKIAELDKEYELKQKSADYTIEEDEESDKKDQKVEQAKSYTITPANFFQFLFFERSKLVNFGNRTQTINFNLFGLKKELSANAIVLWRQLIYDSRETLIKQTSFALSNSWKNLDTLPYNIIATFNKFLIKFTSDGEAIDRNQTFSQNLKIIESFIDPYLKISFQPDYKEILKESLYEVIFANPEFKPTLKDSIRTLEELISTDKRTLCFFNIILSIYSLYFNKFIKFNDLIKYHKITEIQGQNHDFSSKVLNEVKAYLTKIDAELDEIERKLVFLKYIEDELTFNPDLNSKWVKLFNKLSYVGFEITKKMDDNNTISNISEGESFINLNKAVGNYLTNMTLGFLKIYFTIFTKDLKIKGENETSERISIFNRSLFEKELQQLQEIASDYNHIRLSRESILISFDTYQQFKTKGHVNIEKEQKQCLLISNYLSTLKEIAIRLEELLYKHHKTSSLQGEELLEKYKNQNDTITNLNEDIRLIPYAYSTITSHKYLENKKVIEVIHEIVFLVFNLLYLFGDKEILKNMLDKNSLVEKMDRFLKIKSKIN